MRVLGLHSPSLGPLGRCLCHRCRYGRRAWARLTPEQRAAITAEMVETTIERNARLAGNTINFLLLDEPWQDGDA